MKTAIVGPGAIGCLFASLATEAGMAVWLLDYRPERAARLQREPLRRLDPDGQERQIPLAACAEPAAIGPVELVVVCTKSYQTDAAAARLGPLLGPRTAVWTVQNGLGNLEALAEHLEAERLLGGVTAQGAYWDEDGRLVRAGVGPSLVGEVQGGPSSRAEEIAEAWSRAGVPTEACSDIRRAIWSKLLVSAVINPLTALLHLPNGALGERAELRTLARELIEEGAAVARLEGIALDPREVFEQLLAIASHTAPNRSSMRTDLEAGRQTEVEAINGALARLGPAPRHALLAALVRARTGA